MFVRARAARRADHSQATAAARLQAHVRRRDHAAIGRRVLVGLECERLAVDAEPIERVRHADQGVLVELSDTSANHRLARASWVVGEAEARREAALGLRRELLVVVAKAEIQREIRCRSPLVLHEPVVPVVIGVDLDVAHDDRKLRGIRAWVGRIEWQVVAEGERAVVVGADSLRRDHRTVPREPRLEGVGAATCDIRQHVLDGVVPAVGTAVRGGQPGVEVRVCVARADVELVATVQADVFEVVDPARRVPVGGRDAHVREIAVDAVFSDVRELELVGRLIADEGRPADVEHPIVGVELDLPVIERLTALEVLAHGRRHLALPAEREVVRSGGVVDSRERAQRLDERRVGVRDGERRRFGRHGMDHGVLDQVALEVEEEERLVADDWAADVEAEGLSSRFGFLLLRIEKRISGTEALVLEVVEATPREDVRSRLGHGVHDDAGRAAELGGVLVREHLELRHRVERDARLGTRSAAVGVLVGGAVNRPEIAGGRATVDVEVAALEFARGQLRNEAGHELHQRKMIATLAR